MLSVYVKVLFTIGNDAPNKMLFVPEHTLNEFCATFGAGGIT
jgi:hypothetical protein